MVDLGCSREWEVELWWEIEVEVEVIVRCFVLGNGGIARKGGVGGYHQQGEGLRARGREILLFAILDVVCLDVVDGVKELGVVVSHGGRCQNKERRWVWMLSSSVAGEGRRLYGASLEDDDTAVSRKRRTWTVVDAGGYSQLQFNVVYHLTLHTYSYRQAIVTRDQVLAGHSPTSRRRAVLLAKKCVKRWRPHGGAERTVVDRITTHNRLEGCNDTCNECIRAHRCCSWQSAQQTQVKSLLRKRTVASASALGSFDPGGDPCSTLVNILISRPLFFRPPS